MFSNINNFPLGNVQYSKLTFKCVWVKGFKEGQIFLNTAVKRTNKFIKSFNKIYRVDATDYQLLRE